MSSTSSSQSQRQPLTFVEYQITAQLCDVRAQDFKTTYRRATDQQRDIIDTKMADAGAVSIGDNIRRLLRRFRRSRYYRRLDEGRRRRHRDWVEIRGTARELHDEMIELESIQHEALVAAGLAQPRG